MKTKQILFFIMFLAIVPRCVYSAVSRAAGQLTMDEVVTKLSANMGVDDIVKITSGVARVAPAHYGAFVTRVKELWGDELWDGAELWGRMEPCQKASIVSAMSNIPPANYADFVTMIYALWGGMDVRQKVEVIREMSNIPPANYEILATTINELCSEMDARQRHDVLQFFLGIGPANFAAFATTWGEVDDEQKRCARLTISGITPANYAVFTDTVKALLVGVFPDPDTASIILAVAIVDPADYGTMLTLGLHLDPTIRVGPLNAFGFARHGTLCTARALLFARWIDDEEEKEQRILQVLDIGLPDEVPPFDGEFAAGANPYAAGLNVHSKDRDKKTEQAYKFLFSLWNPTPEEIERDSNALIAYVRASGNANAIRALIGEGRTTHDFGALLTSAENEKVKERLAHLWHFATESVRDAINPRDAALTKESIVSGLADAVDNGHLVCNPGKYQRLATSVLQGRLQGVQIDATPIPASTRLVPVTAEILAFYALQEVVEAPADPADQEIRNLDAIEEYLKPLTDGWMRIRPANDTALLQQVFDYIHNLANGQVPGTDGQHIVLDPRDVVFHLIFGKGVTREGGMLDPDSTSTLSELNVADYIAQYQEREQQAYADAKAEAERRALMATQDARFAQVEAMDRAKQEAEAEAERIKTEAAAKMAEERATIKDERIRLASQTPEQRRREIADSYRGLAAGGPTVAETAAPAPAPKEESVSRDGQVKRKRNESAGD